MEEKYYKVSESALTEIAEAIRTQKGSENKYKLKDFAKNIEAMSAVSGSEGVTFGYEKKTVTNTVTASEGKCFYNGVELPEIPADVFAEYPYAWIRKNNTNGTYDLVMGRDLWYFNTDMTCSDNSNIKYYIIPISTYSEADEWNFNKDTTSAFGLDSDRTILWSNHDIPNGSATATEIYFEGTEVVTSSTTTEIIKVPVEREERYSVTSDDLNNIAKRTQEMAGTLKLLTTEDIVYWLGRVKFIPQGWAEVKVTVPTTIETNVMGILPTVYKSNANVNVSISNSMVSTSAVGSLV